MPRRLPSGDMLYRGAEAEIICASLNIRETMLKNVASVPLEDAGAGGVATNTMITDGYTLSLERRRDGSLKWTALVGPLAQAIGLMFGEAKMNSAIWGKRTTEITTTKNPRAN